MKTQRCRCCEGSGKEYDDKAVGAELRSARKRAGIKLSEMAEAMNIGSPYLSDLERGFKRWSDDKIKIYKSVLCG